MEYRPMQYLQRAASATGTTSLSEGVQVGQPPACSATKAAAEQAYHRAGQPIASSALCITSCDYPAEHLAMLAYSSRVAQGSDN